MYLLKLALRPWKLSLFSQLVSAIAVGLLLFLSSVAFWLQGGLKPVVNRLQNEQVITAYLNAASTEPADKVVDSIRTTLGSKSIEVKKVDAADFISHLRDRYPDLGRELEDLGPEAEGVVPRYVSISGVLPDSAIDQVRAVAGVETAETSKDRYKHIVGAFSTLQWVSRVLAFGLCLAVLAGLIHLARMNSYLHRDAVGLLKQWGAGRWTLKAPGMISGIGVGALGGLFGLVGWLTGGVWLTRHVRELSPLLKEMPAASSQMGLVLLGIGLMGGLLSGLFSSENG